MSEISRTKKQDDQLHKIAAQMEWIRRSGKTLAGYIERYGAATDPDKHGDGGAAIYKADMMELKRLFHQFWGKTDYEAFLENLAEMG